MLGTSFKFEFRDLIVGGTIWCVLLIALAAYWNGLGGPFILDDKHNLAAMNNIGGVTNWASFIYFVFGNESGALGRPVTMLSFLINDQYYPGDARFFRFTNLMIHGLTGIAIYILSRLIFRVSNINPKWVEWLALVVMAFWLLVPLNNSTVLYVIQRMAQLSTLFTVVGLVFYIEGRLQSEASPRRSVILMSVGIGLCGLLAVLSKENGILITLFALSIEATVLQKTERPKWVNYWLIAFCILPLALLVMKFSIGHAGLIGGYAQRNFTMSERVLTESRILFDYLRQIVVPTSMGTGVYHDDVNISKGLFQPVSTFVSMVLACGLIFAAFIWRQRAQFFSLAVFWYFGGHVLESSFIPLELYFEHRNYLPMVGVYIALVYYVFVAVKTTLRPITLFILISSIWASGAAFLTYKNSEVWSDPDKFLWFWSMEHPESIRANIAFAHRVLKYGDMDRGLSILDDIYKKNQKVIHIPIVMFNETCDKNVKPVYSIDEMTSRLPSSEYSSSLSYPIENFIKAIRRKKCADYESENIHEFLNGIVALDKGGNKFRAKVSFLHADIYIDERNLSGAMTKLDQAFSYQPSLMVRLKQAKVLASAGVYDGALEFIDKAEELNKLRKFSEPSAKPIIDRYRKDLYKIWKQDQS